VPGATPLGGEAARGQAVIVLERRALPAALETLRDHPETRFDMLSDLTAADYLGRTPRFEVVYQLYSVSLNHRLRVKVPVPEDDPVVARHHQVQPPPRRRDHRRRRGRDRLPPPRLREDVRAGDVEPLLPLRRPPELRLAHSEQRRLRARGREAGGRDRPRALPVHP